MDNVVKFVGDIVLEIRFQSFKVKCIAQSVEQQIKNKNLLGLGSNPNALNLRRFLTPIFKGSNPFTFTPNKFNFKNIFKKLNMFF